MERKFVIRSVVLVVLTLVVYLPAMRAGFVWDDDIMLTKNIVLDEGGLYRTWFTASQFNYWPVVWTSYWLEHQLWGLDPTGYHVDNILMHVAIAVLVYCVLLRLRVPGAWLAAAIFAVHPVNVESVAWVTQRKNLLSMLFYLIAVLNYLRFDSNPRRTTYCAALVAFLLAMLSKGAVATTPVVLLLCVWWLHGTLTRRDCWRSVPFFAVAGLMSCVEIWFQFGRAMGQEAVRNDGIWTRFVGAGWVVWFYVDKALRPIGLSFVYPRWEIDPSYWLAYVPNLALLALLGVGWRCRHGWGRPLLFALSYFIVTLGPVLGFVQFYFMRYSFVGDHYQYVSIIGILALVTAAGCLLVDRFGRSAAQIGYFVAGSVLVALGTLTWQRCEVYQTSESLWNDTLAKNPTCWMAHHNLGDELHQQHRIQEAVYHFNESLRIKPDDPNPHNSIGLVLQHQEEYAAAIEQFQQAIHIDPTFVPAYVNWGVTLQIQGRFEEAVPYFEQAVTINPKHTVALYNWGNTLRDLGRLDEAIAKYRNVVAIDPYFEPAYQNLAAALGKQGKFDLAIPYFQKAIEFGHDDAATHINLGVAFSKLKRNDEAIQQFRKAVELAPDQAPAHFFLATVYLRTGRRELAAKHCRETLRISPTHAPAQEMLERLKL